MEHRISKKNKVRIAVICVLYTLLLLVLFCLIAEDRGFFPGKLLDRPFADIYVKKNYPGLKCRLKSSGYFTEIKNDFGIDYDSRGYRYVYEILEVKEGADGPLSAGDTFSLETYNFKVNYDEIFDKYTFDRELEKLLSGRLLEGFAEYAADNGLPFTPYEVYAGVNVASGLYGDGDDRARVDSAIEGGVIGNASPVLHVKGEKIGFEQYREAVAGIAGIYAEGGTFADDSMHPSFLRVIYHYEDEGKDVVAFESQFQSFQLKYTADMIAAASNMHFKVLLDQKEINQLKAYTIVKSIYIWVILAAIAVLMGFWAYRRIRRLAAFN